MLSLCLRLLLLLLQEKELLLLQKDLLRLKSKLLFRCSIRGSDTSIHLSQVGRVHPRDATTTREIARERTS